MKQYWVLVFSLVVMANASDWTHFKGPNHNLKLPAQDLITDTPGLKIVWTRQLGLGYSQPLVEQGIVYVLFSDGTHDLLAALDAGDGKTLWSYPIAETYQGHSGSEGGPSGTAAIAGDRIVALGPKGHLITLDKKTGKLLWSHLLTEAFKAREPYFGFATSPLVYKDKIVVQVGGPDNNGVMAFNLADGKTVWGIPSGSLGYQSPLLLSLMDRTWLIVHANEEVSGHDPLTGRKHWGFSYHETGFGNIYGEIHDLFGHVMATTEDRFLFDTGHTLYHCQLEKTDEGYSVKELWQSKALKDAPVLPLYHEGYIYGKKGTILTCVDVNTGERVWQSRPPGKGGHIFLGDVLASWNIKGVLSLDRIGPEGITNLASQQVLKKGTATTPVYVNGVFYLRNTRELAAVALTRESKEVAEAGTESSPMGLRIGTLLKQLEGVEDKQAIIDDYFEKNPQVPIIEGDLVTFIYRSKASDVGMFMGNISRIGDRKMKQVAGTNLWYDTYRVNPNARYEYQFVVNLGEEGSFDPIYQNAGPSQLIMPGWQEPRWLTEDIALAGRVEERVFKSEELGNERTLKIYLPPGYDQSQKKYPLLFVNGAVDVVEQSQLHKALDHLGGKAFEEVVAVFFPVRWTDNEWWLYNAGFHREPYGRAVTRELIPFLEKHYRLESLPQRRLITGVDIYGFGALHMALNHDDVFGNVLAQSIYCHNGAMANEMLKLIEEKKAHLKVYIDWCAMDVYDPGEDTDIRRDSLRIAKALLDTGHNVTQREIDAGRGWGVWRAQVEVMLSTFLPNKD